MAKKEKGLRKVTESVETNDMSTITKNVLYKHPELPQDATPAQRQARVNAIMQDFLESPLVPEDQKEDLRNQTWQANHSELTRVIGNLINEHGRMPTVNQLEQQTGLSRQTIHKHLKEFYQSTRYQTQLAQFRVLLDQVLTNLYKLAINGDVRAAKVYIDAVGGLPQPVGHPGETANYIQVNNNVKIDQVTFTTLPGEVQQQIANLILAGLQTTKSASDQ